MPEYINLFDTLWMFGCLGQLLLAVSTHHAFLLPAPTRIGLAADQGPNCLLLNNSVENHTHIHTPCTPSHWQHNETISVTGWHMG